ncbi:FAD-dependent monooxygenase [Pseudanabaenaceae cyanobacterium LEGE 13415]|nr:FAD-dependent monooxygenase [Pseudanabaenaceae cyanobacterium LEGE 13415]
MSFQSMSKQSNSAHSNVLIIGGGPTGLATALMLAKRGWTKITVLEKSSSAEYHEPDKSFNYLIDGRGQKLTDFLGLSESLANLGVPNTAFYITRIQPNGKRKTSKLSIVNANRKTAYWIPRRVFVQLLYEEIERHWKDYITVLFDTRCTEINRVSTQENCQMLEVVVQQSQHTVEKFEPFFLIGCDGIQSTVRKTLKQWDGTDRFEPKRFPSPSSGLKYKVLSLRPQFPLNHHQDPAVSTMAYAIRSAGRDRTRFLTLGLLPIKDDAASRPVNIINQPDHQIWSLKTGEQVLQFLEQDFPQLPIRQILSIDEADRFAKSEGGVFPSPQFCSGLHCLLKQRASETMFAGIVLLGDAIHCFPPDIGQGVNAALEDVVVLNDALCQAQNDLTQALPQYEELRALDVVAVVRLAQTAAPYQYNQSRWQARLWFIQFFLRLGISRLLPVVSPPAFFLLQNQQLSYREIWDQEQRGSQVFRVLSIALISGLLVTALINF